MSAITPYRVSQVARSSMVDVSPAVKPAATSGAVNSREEQLGRQLEDQLSSRINTIRRQMNPEGGSSTPAPGSIVDILA